MLGLETKIVRYSKKTYRTHIGYLQINNQGT